MDEKKETLIRLVGEPTRGTCGGRTCGAAIDWYETLRGKRMPMDAGAVPRRSETDQATGRVIVFMAASDSHWNSCPDRPEFGR
jgi:hypothetical protein